MKKTREIPRTAPCPCGSGKQYQQCCKKKKFKWVRDADGAICRQVPMHSEVAKVLKDHEKKFKRIYKRKPNPDEPVFSGYSAKEIENATVDMLIKAGASPEYIYAYMKTGLLLSEFNIDLLPDKDLEEWRSAQKEFFDTLKKHRKPQKSDRFFIAVKNLSDEIDVCETFFRKIVQLHGVALNIKRGVNGDDSFHDFILFCFTKTLKNFLSIQKLLDAHHGEDALVLIRTMYESYLTINFLIANPDEINSFVAAEVGRSTGDFQETRDRNNKRVLRDKSSGVEFEYFSPAKMAKMSRYKEDIQIYHFFYNYLSEFAHPNIMSMESYLDGHQFDASGRSKSIQAGIYAIFCACLILDSMAIFKLFSPQLRCDLCVFLRRAKRKLKMVFGQMKGSGQHAKSPLHFKARADHLGDHCERLNNC